MAKETKEIDTKNTNVPVCPWCGEEDGDWGELFPSNVWNVKTDCTNCDEPIEIYLDINPNFCTYKDESKSDE